VKRAWAEEELVERWTLGPDELPLGGTKSGSVELGSREAVFFCPS